MADPASSQDRGAVSAANGVVHAGNIAGWMYAFDAETGTLRWSFRGERSSYAGPAISGGNVFWGNGYTFPVPGLYTPSTSFYAFSLDGRWRRRLHGGRNEHVGFNLRDQLDASSG